MVKFLLWCILLVLCWPLALARARVVSDRLAAPCCHSASWALQLMASSNCSAAFCFCRPEFCAAPEWHNRRLCRLLQVRLEYAVKSVKER